MKTTQTNKSTPGPWRIWRTRTTGEQTILGGDGLALCDVFPCPERDANARVIAKSLEMRDVLGALFTHCVMVHKHWGEDSNLTQANAAIEQVRALLAELDGPA